MNKITIAKKKLLDGYKYVLTSACDYFQDQFFVDLGEAESAMMRYSPGVVWVMRLEEYIRGEK